MRNWVISPAPPSKVRYGPHLTEMFAAKAVVLCLLVHLVSSQNCLNYISTKESICNEIFKRLEKQIVDNDANLFSLRKVTSQTEPSLVNVSYDLQVSL